MAFSTGSAGSSGGSEQAMPRPLTAFDIIERATVEVGELANRVVALSIKLVGEQPPSNPSATKDPTGGGQLGTLASHANGIRSAVGNMHEVLSRIEQQLP